MDRNSKNYQDWIFKAENDLKAAKAILEYYEYPPTDTICYHCHQVAEKSIKGYLVFRNIMFRKFHDLVALLNICLAADKELDILKDDIEVLNQYYIEAKYPVDMPIVYSKDEAKEAINRAEYILGKIKESMK